MSSRRALISTDDLRRMAKVVAEQGVTFRGRVDALGMSFSIVPTAASVDGGKDDLDDRLDAFGAL